MPVFHPRGENLLFHSQIILGGFLFSFVTGHRLKANEIKIIQRLP